MKNISKFIVVLLLITAFTSCEDESTNPLPEPVQIGLVRAEVILPTNSIINLAIEDDNLMEISITSPQGNVDSYTLMGKAKIGGVWSEYVDLKTITEFPSSITISAAEILAAFDEGAITHGTQFKVLGTSVSEGITVNTDNVVGSGFDPGDNPDGVESGLITAYVPSSTYFLINP